MRGRGHTRIEQSGVKRRVSETGIVRLPKVLRDAIYVANQEVRVILVKDSNNPLAWEIKIVPEPSGKQPTTTSE